MIENLFKELSSLEEVEAIALGGSRAGDAFDEKSDYDIYLYISKPVPEEKREEILSQYCNRMELGNHFWEYEDNCVLKNGIDIDILYRSIDDFAGEIASVVEEHTARNGYTTCMWHNLKTCRIIFDRSGRLTALQKKYTCPYPKELKQNIIERNRKLLRYSLPAFEGQISKAVKRGDMNSVNHRTTEFMASYFDIIFALNEVTHPGEKRLVALCKRDCKLLPADFEENITKLFQFLYSEPDKAMEIIGRMIDGLEELIGRFLESDDEMGESVPVNQALSDINKMNSEAGDKTGDKVRDKTEKEHVKIRR